MTNSKYRSFPVVCNTEKGNINELPQACACISEHKELMRLLNLVINGCHISCIFVDT